MANISQFNRESQQRIADVVRRVEQSPPAPSQRGHRITPHAKEVRWGITATTYEHPTYPSSGPVYGVKLGELVPSPDPPYPGATVTNTLVPYDPAVEIIATDPEGNSWGEGSIVRVERHDGRWWIRPEYSSTPMEWKSLYLTCDLVNGGGSQITYSAAGGWKVYQHWGTDGGYTLAANTSRSTYTDWCFSLDTAGRYMFVIDWTSSGPVSTGDTTKTYTTGSASAGTAHTHPVVVDAERYGYLRTTFERQAGGSGSWASLPSTTGGNMDMMFFNWVAADQRPTVCTVFDEPAVTANDRFRFQTYATIDGRDTTPGDWKWARSGLGIRMMITRLGDAETPAFP